MSGAAYVRVLTQQPLLKGRYVGEGRAEVASSHRNSIKPAAAGMPKNPLWQSAPAYVREHRYPDQDRVSIVQGGRLANSLACSALREISMHIFIDESGPFGGIGQFPSVSVIGALIVPDGRLPSLEKQYNALRANLPKDDKGEVKGRLLNEQQVDSAVSILFADSALYEAAAIDMGLHTEAGLKTFQAAQAEKMTANLTDEHQEALKAQVWAARKTFEGFKLPLMVQAIMTFEFIFELLEFATMYYAARRPEELGKFHWVIDAKGTMDKPNEWEEWWSSFIFPVLQTRSFARPFRQLPEGVGDYSHLARFETEPDPFIRARGNWKDGDPPPLDLGLVMKESFTFAVQTTPGLELVDIITNATRRAFRGNLEKQGWHRIPQLMVHRGKRRPYLSMLSLQDDPEPNRVYPYTDVLEAFRRDGRLLLPKGLREKVQRQ
jgi:hypothetical protein